ncbi:MAG: bifunctional 3-(3-hydroxy-phenyl)propionate/3-hydroxycinnamic acid hydroxylase [Myxococcales bacterium]|nr:bifunctional 3-(3-hydroxy-phenyl)propionate/3-hydroxycinnamic acid hydroxylase [Deltaproteobacteria bacterium]NNL25859.1 bifunctional 3-(3-hydroxy-phenyl)propionate/3-hydroxycinnamic acid hydroxylase [Myxococcales bacterium]
MSAATNTDSVDVIIAGLGPTGLVLAHFLGKHGHSVVVLEREPVFYGNARAVYTDDECMRVLQSIDAAEEASKDMLVDTPVQLCRADGTPMGQLKNLDKPFGWPVVNFFYQPYLETKLAKLLARYPNVEVRRGRELTDLEQGADGVAVTHQATQEARYSELGDARATTSTDPDPQTLRAKYLVGADGGRSTVREKLGIQMTGKNFPEPWLVVDLKVKNGQQALRHLPYFNFFCDPECPAVSCPQPDGHHRFEFRLREGQTKEHMEKPETVRAYLSKYVDPDKFEVKRRLVYTFNALMAERWRDGRILLAGDAAHMTPQFMGQGASAGIRDASNLGWKLSAVLAGKADPSLLDTYQTERKPHAQSMIDVSVFMKDVVSMSNPMAAALRNLTLKGIQATPGLRDWLQEARFKPKPTYKKGNYFGMPRRRLGGPEGTMTPQPEVRSSTGRRALLDDVVGEGFAVVGQGLDPRAHLSKQSQALLDGLDARYINLYGYGDRPQGRNETQATPPGVIELEDVRGNMLDWFKKARFSKGGAALIRPDGFAFAVVDAQNLDGAVDALKQQLGQA